MGHEAGPKARLRGAMNDVRPLEGRGATTSVLWHGRRLPHSSKGVSSGMVYYGPASTVGGPLPVAVCTAQTLPLPRVE